VLTVRPSPYEHAVDLGLSVRQRRLKQPLTTKAVCAGGPQGRSHLYRFTSEPYSAQLQ
jgi:hypothetical protein